MLIDRCFPPGHVLHSVINRNTVKLRYSCLANMGTIIRNKNNKLLKGRQTQQDPSNCPPEECPVEERCETSNVIYQAILTTNNQETHKYVGLTEGTFLDRFRKHQSSFRVNDPRNSTSLSKKVLELKRKHTPFNINWKILQISGAYKPGGNDCRLCLEEIYYIIFHPAESTLNSRQEFLNKCRHKAKFKLCNN